MTDLTPRLPDLTGVSTPTTEGRRARTGGRGNGCRLVGSKLVGRRLPADGQSTLGAAAPGSGVGGVQALGVHVHDGPVQEVADGVSHRPPR